MCLERIGQVAGRMRNLTRRSFVARALGGAVAAPTIISTSRANEPLPPFPSLSSGDALLLRPGDSHFADYQASFNLRTALKPQLRALCKTAKAAGVMVDWCRSNNLPFAVRCGGPFLRGLLPEPERHRRHAVDERDCR